MVSMAVESIKSSFAIKNFENIRRDLAADNWNLNDDDAPGNMSLAYPVNLKRGMEMAQLLRSYRRLIPVPCMQPAQLRRVISASF